MRKLTVVMAVICSLLSGCADQRVPPFASTPFSVARAGNEITIPFTVPASAPLDYEYMLAFKYQQPEVGDPLPMFWSNPQSAHLFLDVRLVSVGEDGREVNVDLNGYDRGDGSVQMANEFGPQAFNVEMHSARRGVAYLEVAFFKLPRHGNYRFYVQTVTDSVIFASIPSWLTVEREYRRHK